MSIHDEKRGIIKTILALIIMLCILMNCFSAYALDEKYVMSYTTWSDIENCIYYDDDWFQGQLKYLQDEDNGCLYLNLDYYDTRISSNSKSDVYLVFLITNEYNSYKFTVDENGFRGLADTDVSSSFYVSGNFNDALSKKKGGKLNVGIEFKNSADRKTNNNVKCIYYCGADISHQLFENISMDMKSEEYSDDSVENVKSQNKKSTTKKTETTTKFIPKKYETTIIKGSTKRNSSNSSVSNETKFSSTSGYVKENNSTNVNIFDSAVSENMVGDSIVDIEDSVLERKTKLSPFSVALMCVSLVIFLAGSGLIVFGVLKNRRNVKAKLRREKQLKELDNKE